MRGKTVLRGAAAVALALVPFWPAARAAEADSITLSATFHADSIQGTVGADLAAVLAGGNDNSWTITLHGVTYSHELWNGGLAKATLYDATSFDLVFAGPDASTLNSVVAGSVTGGTATLWLENSTAGSNWSAIGLSVLPTGGWGTGVSLYAGHELVPNDGHFPADADGFPVVTSDAFAFYLEETFLTDNRDGSSGSLIAWDEDAAISGSVGTPTPPPPPPPPPAGPSASVADAVVTEGDRRSRKVSVKVTLSAAPGKSVSVAWHTVSGTATAGQDFTAASGTLTFKSTQTSKTISVSVTGDRTPEPDETFGIELTNPNGIAIADGVAVVTILNDD